MALGKKTVWNYSKVFPIFLSVLTAYYVFELVNKLKWYESYYHLEQMQFQAIQQSLTNYSSLEAEDSQNARRQLGRHPRGTHRG